MKKSKKLNIFMTFLLKNTIKCVKNAVIMTGVRRKFDKDVLRILPNEKKDHFIKRATAYHAQYMDIDEAKKTAIDMWFTHFLQYRMDDRFIMNAF